MALAGALDHGRSFVEAILEGLFAATLYAPFFALCEVKVEPEPRWWKAAGAVGVMLWFGFLPAISGWMLDYWSSLTGALIAGAVFSSFWGAVIVFGGRERWCTAAAGVFLLATGGAWITGLVPLGEASALGLGGAIFFVMLAALGGD